MATTTTPDSMSLDVEEEYDVVKYDEDLANLDNRKSINAAQKADTEEEGFDFVDLSEFEEELKR